MPARQRTVEDRCSSSWNELDIVVVVVVVVWVRFTNPIISLHRTHKMRTIAISDQGVCHVCHTAYRGFAQFVVQT